MKRSSKSVPHDSEHGFTLVELLVMVVVIGILAAIVVFALSSPAQQSLRSACRSDAHAVEVAQEARRTVAGAFAPNVAGLVPQYLRGVPGNTAHYLLSTDATGTVWVAQAPAGPPAATSTQPNPCDAIS